ncbi:unnamed protein product [Spirodela intermedia]|uniref:Uncharacterized protein n=1 Tax=Spirodela intermedia TaxID=51605 RepID=A0A7I8IBJ2_SPIIN|nr:unnamed protein product [Spirodela intermedia]CAA6655116.1 unnamed protein product [Spirodela intermedia]
MRGAGGDGTGRSERETYRGRHCGEKWRAKTVLWSWVFRGVEERRAPGVGIEEGGRESGNYEGAEEGIYSPDQRISRRHMLFLAPAIPRSLPRSCAHLPLLPLSVSAPDADPPRSHPEPAPTGPKLSF